MFSNFLCYGELKKSHPLKADMLAGAPCSEAEHQKSG